MRLQDQEQEQVEIYSTSAIPRLGKSLGTFGLETRTSMNRIDPIESAHNQIYLKVSVAQHSPRFHNPAVLFTIYLLFKSPAVQPDSLL